MYEVKNSCPERVGQGKRSTTENLQRIEEGDLSLNKGKHWRGLENRVKTRLGTGKEAV